MKVLNSKVDLNKLSQALYESDNCREYFKNHAVETWIYDYAYSYESDISVCSKNKQYILYSLIYTLNELKPLPPEMMKMYMENVDSILEEVTSTAKEEKNWLLDENTSLALCSRIIVDYTYYTITKESEACIDNEFSSKDLTDVFAFLGLESKKDSIQTSASEDYNIYIYPDSDIPILNQLISKYPDRIYNELVDIINAPNLSFAQQA